MNVSQFADHLFIQKQGDEEEKKKKYNKLQPESSYPPEFMLKFSKLFCRIWFLFLFL